MLKKVVLSIAMVGIAFATGYATAQSYFLTQTTLPVSNPAIKNPQPADDFQNQTQQQLDKKNQALDSQLSQELAKIPPPPPPPAPHEEAAGTAAGTTPGQEAGSGTTQAKSSAPAPAAPDLTPTGPSPAAPPATAPNSAQVYTGFQNSNPGSTATPNQSQPSSGSGGGWNIKY